MAVWADADYAEVASGVTSITATLAGGAPDSTHTLVAFLGTFSATWTDPADWTPVNTVNNGSTNLALFMRQGNGSVDSFTSTLGSTPGGGWLHLFSIPGYVSLTPDLYEEGTEASVNGATGHTINATGSTTATNTVAFLASNLTGSSTAAGNNWGDYDNGFTEIEALGSGGRLTVGVKAYTSSGQTPSATYFFGTDRERGSAFMVVAVQGTSADAGGTAHEGAGTLTVTFAATGSGVRGRSAAGTLTGTFAATGAGSVGTAGAGTLQLGFAATGTAKVTKHTAGALTVGFGATGTGSVARQAEGTLEIGVAFTGDAAVGGNLTGAGTLGIGFAASGVAAVTKHAAGTLDIGFGPTGAGVVGKHTGGTLTIGADLDGTGTRGRVAAGTLTIGFAPTGLARAGFNAAGALTVAATLTGSGTVTVDVSGFRDIALVAVPLPSRFHATALQTRFTATPETEN